MFKKSLFFAVALVSMTGIAEARDQIKIVGSSTVYPFSTVVAEQFGKTTSFKTPVVESTGSGGWSETFLRRYWGKASRYYQCIPSH